MHFLLFIEYNSKREKKMDTKQEILIPFFARYREYYDEIRNLLSDNQKQKYKNTRLSSLVRSLSRRLSEMKVITDNITLEMTEIRKILNSKSSEVEKSIKKGTVFPWIEPYHIYRILAYMEILIAFMKSAVDFIYSYIRILWKEVLEKGNIRLDEKLKNAEIDMKWKKELDAIRNDFLHQYSGWPSFIKKNGTYDVILLLPSYKVTNEESKKFKEDKLTTTEINNMYEGFGKFYDETRLLIIKEIKKINRRISDSEDIK